MLKNQTFFILFSLALRCGPSFGQSPTAAANPDSALANALAALTGEPLRLADLVAVATTRSVGAQDADAALMAARGSLL